MLAGLFAIVVGIDACSRNMPEQKISEHWTTQQDVSETLRNPTHFFPIVAPGVTGKTPGRLWCHLRDIRSLGFSLKHTVNRFSPLL